MDGRAVETLYRAGRYEDIAIYCLEDVRATGELYLKLEKTLLQFEPSFRDAEERASRRRTASEQLSILQQQEPSFMDAVTRTSLTLSSALDLEVSSEEEEL
jgi:predicted PolB exonuclease-like 3'-5' exonuclease